MVFESVASIILSRFLDKFFYGINKKNIQLGILDGKLLLSNIGLQPNLLMSLNLPIQLKYSYVQKVEINLPWRDDETIININISNIYVLVAARPNFYEDVFEIFNKKKETVIQQALKQFKANLQKTQNKKEYGTFQKMFLNLLDNVNIKIECIHLRYQNTKNKYSFGVKINQVNARTVNKQDKQQYFNRQKSKEQYIRYILEMDFMGIYFNSKQQHFLQRKTLAEITDEFNRLSHKHLKNYSDNFDSQDNLDSFNYILTISLNTYIKKYINALEHLSENKNQKYLFQCEINLNKIQSKITDQQYYDIMDLTNFFSQYQRYYQYFTNSWHFSNFREKKAKEILDLVHKKNRLKGEEKYIQKYQQKYKDVLQKHCQKYLRWIFKNMYEEVLKRKFIKEAIRDDVNVKKLLANKKLLRIIRKIDNQKLKLWILISLYYRNKFEDKVNIFLRSSEDKWSRFCQKYIDSIKMLSPLQFQDQILRNRESSSDKYQVFLKLVLKIEQLNFQISKQNTFGVSFNINKFKTQLILRQKNYLITIAMEDLEANVFNCKKYQKMKTYVPIIKRNCVLDRNIQLLQIKYQRNPVGKPFVFTQIQVMFQSIQITLYPQAFKQFYQILLGDSSESQKKKKGKKGKKKQQVEQNYDRTTVRQIGFQKTIIKGKVKSPWIVLPLSINNDLSKECWVVRLGDLSIDTPQHDFSQIKTEEQLFYQQYILKLERFQLKYFSSINFFHNWQKFNQITDNLYKIKTFQKQKIITMIQPFSCSVNFSVLKNFLSPAIRQKKPKFVGKIVINDINIKISKFLLTKLKYRLDTFGQNKQESTQFIQTNVSNIREQNDLMGHCKISYEGIKKLTFHCILKGNFMYFFINQTHHRYHFYVNMTEVAIRLISNQVQNFNTEKEKQICFYLNDRQKHQMWRKKLIYLINRKDRRMDATLMSTIRNTGSETDILGQTKKQKSDFYKQQNKQQQAKEKEDNIDSSSSTKINLTFLMNKLSINLIDQNNQQFLNCLFNKATFIYHFQHQKIMTFSLNQWIVNETNKNMVFLSSHSFFDQEENLHNTHSTNFLDIKFNFNQITEELQTINVNVDKLFLAWKVQLFTKILLFFFYQQQVGDAPTPINFNKRQLQIIFKFKKFNFYCYFNQQLIALTKLQDIDIIYSQDNVQEKYVVRCRVFQMDKYVNNDRTVRLPMIKPKPKHGDLHPHDSGCVDNNFDLVYVFRKKQTDSFPNIVRLKQRLGDDILVSEITCNWKDTIIYFQNQLTFRLLNYILSKVLGTVAAKFKKKQYSPKYIFEAMKLRKLSVFDIALTNMIFRMPPHERGFRQFVLQLDQMRVTKNIEDQYQPIEKQVQTIEQNLFFFYQSMVFKISRARLSYQRGRQSSIPIHINPFDMNFISSKLNFQRQYFVILKHHDDIDRKSLMDVIIEQPVVIQAHKIIFVTFLQLFYQNLKHRDGLAEIFEPPLPFPSLRQYNIYVQLAGFNMYDYNQTTNNMHAFSKNIVNGLKVKYVQVGSQSNIEISGESLSGTGQLPIRSLNTIRNKFKLEIQSKQGQMKVIINAEYYALEVNLDNVNNIVQFINYDNDYVINKIMPKKTSSWQYVNVFAKNCQIRLGKLHASGDFYISYLKGMKNDVELAAKKYLLTEQELDIVNNDAAKLNWDVLTDKQIKVNGEELKVSIEGDTIGEVSSFYFNRCDITSKQTNRRFKRERVQVGEGIVFVQLTDLLTIWDVYNNYIKKNPKFVLRNFFQPSDTMDPKLKAIEKRTTEVQINKISISILPTLQVKYMLYLKIDLQIPQIIYRTYLDQQQVTVTIKCSLFHSKQKMRQMQVGQCKHFKLRYNNFKDRKQKWIQILSAKDVVVNVYDLNNSIIAHMMEEFKTIKTIQRQYLKYDPKKHTFNDYAVIFKNQTSKRVKFRLNKQVEFSVVGGQNDARTITFQTMLDFVNQPNSFMQLHEQGCPIVKIYAGDINIYRSTEINNNLLIFDAQTRKTVVIYRSAYSITNCTQATLYYPSQKKVLKNGQKYSFIPQNKNGIIQIQLRSLNWNQQFEIDPRKSNQIIGDESFIVVNHKIGIQNSMVVKNRYYIKNAMMNSMIVDRQEIPPSQQIAVGYLSKTNRQNYTIIINQNTQILNLALDRCASQFKGKFTNINNQQQLLSCTIMSEAIKTDGVITINIYCPVSIKNDSNRRVVFTMHERDYWIGPKQSLLMPADITSLVFKDKTQLIIDIHQKVKCVYSDSFKFQIISKLLGKAMVLRIEPKCVLINNSIYAMKIQTILSDLQIVKSQQIVQISQLYLHSSSINLCFQNYLHEEFLKSIDINKKGVNYIQIEGQLLKVSVIGKDQSTIIMIEDSKIAILIINKLEDITVIARTYQLQQQPSKQGKGECIKQIIKTQKQGEIGLFSWDSQQVELQFYYQPKDIDFKQKFSINLQAKQLKYSYKHIVHDQKTKKFIFTLIITIEKDAEGRHTITIYKDKDYQNIAIQKMKVSIHQVSISLLFSSQVKDAITVQLYKATLLREKGVQLTDIDLQIQKLLVREGKNISIINALNNGKFLNCNVIINKTLKGIGISNLMLKIIPFEIILREKIIFLVLQKIVEVRAQSSRKGEGKTVSIDSKIMTDSSKLEESIASRQSKIQEINRQTHKQLSIIKPSFELTVKDECNVIKLDKDWQSQLSKQIKGKRIFVISNLQISQTSIFISYTKQEYKQFDQKIVNDKIIRYMLLIPPISQLKIAFPHLKINDFQGDGKQFGKQLVNRLKQSIGSNIVNSFSSLPLFDSPVIAADGLFRYIDGMLSIQ